MPEATIQLMKHACNSSQ